VKTSHWLEQGKLIAVSLDRAGSVHCLVDRWKLDIGEVAKDVAEWSGSHVFGRNSSSARTKSSVASTCGQCPTGSSMGVAPSSVASSRDPAIGIGSKMP
jgi:hypothetical protein